MARKHRIKEAEFNKDTDRLWDLITVAAEEANIKYHMVSKADAKKLRGRSKVTVKRTLRIPIKYDDEK